MILLLHVVEAGQFLDLADAHLEFLAAEALERGAVFEVLVDAHLGVERHVLGHVAEVLADLRATG